MSRAELAGLAADWDLGDLIPEAETDAELVSLLRSLADHLQLDCLVRAADRITTLREQPLAVDGEEVERDITRLAANDLTVTELIAERERVEQLWDKLRGDDAFEGHGGSPGEWMFERLDENETTLRRVLRPQQTNGEVAALIARLRSPYIAYEDDRALAADALEALSTRNQVGETRWLTEFLPAILHGDDVHRAWLTEAFHAFVEGRDIPPPTSSPTPDQTTGEG